MGAFAELYGIDPLRWYDLSVRDTLQLELYLDERNRRMKEEAESI